MLTEAQQKALKRVSQIEKIAKDPHGQILELSDNLESIVHQQWLLHQNFSSYTLPPSLFAAGGKDINIKV
jgi:hypothetical protein